MAQSETPRGQKDLSAPLIPPRNPLRNNYHLQKQLRSLREKHDSHAVKMSSPTAQRIFNEIDRELTDTQQKFLSSLHDARELNDEDKLSQTSTSSNLADGLQRYSSYLIHGGLPAFHNSDEQLAKQRELDDAMTRMRSNYNQSDSLASTSSYSGPPESYNTGEEEALVEAWLERGSVVTLPPQSDCTSQSSKSRDFTPKKRHRLLTIFPPASPNTGKREYASPMSPLSPMNNGRDAYGNYIPTNTRDYFAIQSPPVSPILLPNFEETPPRKLSSMPYLRGGGGWWNALSSGQIRKKPSVKASTAKRESSHRNTPIQTLGDMNSVGGQDEFSRKLKAHGGGSQVEGLSTSANATANDKALDVVEDDWSDESDHDIFDAHHQHVSRQFEPNINIQSGNVQVRRWGRLNDSAALKLGHRSLTNNDTRHEFEELTGRDDRRPPRIDTMTDLESDLITAQGGLNPPMPIANTGKRPESPVSDISYGAREKKRWNRGPATGPPAAPALLPSPSLQGKHSLSEVISFVKPLLISKHTYEGPSSPAELYDDKAWELQSLQFGESVSLAGRSPRRNPRESPTRQHICQLSPEEFEASQKAAQTQFRPLCQDIMTRFNAEISRLDRVLHLNEMSPEQHKVHVDWNAENKNKALKHSAETSGYLILEDEPRILDAIKTADGYAIYHDMLRTTEPELWHRLDEQHQMSKAAQMPIQKPRESSFDQARHAAGKLARLLLASPSDPDLKTHSSRKPAYGKSARITTSVPHTWMDPMAAAAFTGSQDNEAWRTRKKRDKGKSRAHGPTAKEEVDTRYFAHSGALSSGAGISGLTGTTAVKSDGHWTGPTAVPSSRVAQSTEQPHNQHSNDLESLLYAGSDSALHQPNHATTTVSDESMWPQGDSQGNWHVPKRAARPGLRGGEGKKEKKKKRSPWLNVHHTEAMRFFG